MKEEADRKSSAINRCCAITFQIYNKCNARRAERGCIIRRWKRWDV